MFFARHLAAKCFPPTNGHPLNPHPLVLRCVISRDLEYLDLKTTDIDNSNCPKDPCIILLDLTSLLIVKGLIQIVFTKKTLKKHYLLATEQSQAPSPAPPAPFTQFS